MKEVYNDGQDHEQARTDTDRLMLWAKSLAARSEGVLTAIDQPRSEDVQYRELDKFYYPSVMPRLDDSDEVIDEQWQRFYTNNHNWLLNEASNLFTGNSFYESVTRIRNNSKLLNEVRESVQNGENVAIITNHPNLMSPILDQVAIDAAFADIRISQRMVIVANKALAWLNFTVARDYKTFSHVHEMNCLDIATKVADTYCCIPDSDSAGYYGLGEYSDEINPKMLRGLASSLHSGGRIVTFAGSGSLDLMPTAKRTNITMKQASAVTARLIGKYFNRAMAAVSWVNPNIREIDIVVSDSLTPMSGSNSLHDLMQQMEEPYYELVNGSKPDGIPVRYDFPKNL